MKYEFFFEQVSSIKMSAYANAGYYRWECGGSFASDWAEKRWYEGIIVFSKESTKWYFFFKTHEVRDTTLSEFKFGSFFGEDSVLHVLDFFEKNAKNLENSPFPFVEVGGGFVELSSVAQIENSDIRIDRGEDGWG